MNKKLLSLNCARKNITKGYVRKQLKKKFLSINNRDYLLIKCMHLLSEIKNYLDTGNMICQHVT